MGGEIAVGTPDIDTEQLSDISCDADPQFIIENIQYGNASLDLSEQVGYIVAKYG